MCIAKTLIYSAASEPLVSSSFQSFNNLSIGPRNFCFLFKRLSLLNIIYLSLRIRTLAVSEWCLWTIILIILSMCFTCSLVNCKLSGLALMLKPSPPVSSWVDWDKWLPVWVYEPQCHHLSNGTNNSYFAKTRDDECRALSIILSATKEVLANIFFFSCYSKVKIYIYIYWFKDIS